MPVFELAQKLFKVGVNERKRTANPVLSVIKRTGISRFFYGRGNMSLVIFSRRGYEPDARQEALPVCRAFFSYDFQQVFFCFL